MKELHHPHFVDRLAQLSKSSDLLWLIGSSIGLGFTLIAAFSQNLENSTAGQFWVYASLLLRASLYLGARDWLPNRGGESLRQLFGLGIVAGIFELLVDWWLVHGVSHGQLVYLGKNDVVLLASPIWMPLAWACVIVELGYPALRLYGFFLPRLSAWRPAVLASLFVGLLAGVMVGFYEVLAVKAGWWRYERANAMIGENCALFIPLGECLMFFTILPIAAQTIAEEERPAASALKGGILFALAIAGGYSLAYFMLEV